MVSKILFPLSILFSIGFVASATQSSSPKKLELSSLRVPPPHTAHVNAFRDGETRRRFCGGTGAYLMTCSPYHQCQIKNFGRGATVVVHQKRAGPNDRSYCVVRKNGEFKNPRYYYNCQAGCHFEKSSKMHCDKHYGITRCYSAKGWRYKGY